MCGKRASKDGERRVMNLSPKYTGSLHAIRKLEFIRKQAAQKG